MASNTKVNKVVYGGTTLIDLTGDNATAADVRSGKKFHLPSGAQGTGSMANKAAATYYPSTADQSISSGQYLTGAQTIKAVKLTNLTAENIKSGVTVHIGDASDTDRVTSVTGTYSGGSSTPSNAIVTPNSTAIASTITAGKWWNDTNGRAEDNTKYARTARLAYNTNKHAITMTDATYQFEILTLAGTNSSAAMIKNYGWCSAGTVVIIDSSAPALAVSIKRVDGADIASSEANTIKAAFVCHSVSSV